MAYNIFIIDSPYQIKSLYTTFANRLRKAKKKDISLEARYQFFSEFVSSGGLQLLYADTRALASVTRHWELTEDNVKVLEIFSHLWKENPRFFWEGHEADQNIIRRCINHLENIRKIEPIKRKVLLIMLSQEVQERQKQISTE